MKLDNKLLNQYILEIAADPVRRQKALNEIGGHLARISFAEFVKRAWPTVEPSTPLDWNWHHQLICDTLQAMFCAWRDARSEQGKRHRFTKGLPKNAVFNLPPGSLKSRIIAVCYQVWCWIHEPGMKFICLSVNEDAMLRDARMSRDLIRSEWFQDTFKPKWQLKKDQEAVGNYGNTHGGERLSKASGSEIVGLRGDCLGGSSRVLTEVGEIPIEQLHEMSVRGDKLPRVYALNESGSLELRAIQATRRVKSSKTRIVCTEANNVLLCTDDHKLHNGSEYSVAKNFKPGSSLSILPRADKEVKNKPASTLPRVQVRNTNVPTLPDSVSEIRSGTRQKGKERGERSFLQQELFVDSPTTGDMVGLLDLQEIISTTLQEIEQANMLHGVCRSVAQSKNKNDGRQNMSLLSKVVYPNHQSPTVLRQNMRGATSFDSNARGSESPFQEFTGLRWESLGEVIGIDSSARRLALHGLRGFEHDTEITSTSYRSQSSEQHPGEFDHTLRSLSHDTSQIQRTAVLSNDETPEARRGEEIFVYDLQVEGLHNFVAEGVISHNCLLIDDPNNPKEAENKLERDHVNNLWTTNQANRVNNPLYSMRIGVQQRTHAIDWTGYVLANQGLWSPDNEYGWLHIVLPVEFEKSRAFVMPECLAKYCTWPGAVIKDPRTEEGQSLHEQRFTKEYLASEKHRWKNTGNYVGQMQQRPAAMEGQKVNRRWWGWFRLVDGVRDDIVTGHFPRPPMCHDGEAQVVHQKHFHPDQWDFDWITISVDPAAKKTEKGSLYGLLCIAGKGGRRYVLDDRSQRGAFHEILEVIGDMVKTWRPDTILIEPKAAGPDLMDTLREQMLAGDLPMVGIEEAEPGNMDKEMRFEASVPYIKNGAVYLLDGAEWLEEFVNELSAFPAGETDDRVDALSQCLNSKRAADDELPDW